MTAVLIICAGVTLFTFGVLVGCLLGMNGEDGPR